MRFACIAALSLVVLFPLLARRAEASIGPENVAVVVNGDSINSLRVANEYARLRGIPSSNFIVLHDLGSVEYLDVNSFRNKILKPVYQIIQERGLSGQIDCISYSADMPYSVNVSDDVHGRTLPQILTQQASVNGLTYLSDWTLKGDINYLRLDVNRYARHLLPISSGKELTPAEEEESVKAQAKYDAKDYRSAITLFEKLLEVPRSDPTIAYNLACCQALSGDSEGAIQSLRKAVGAGWRNFGQTSSDPDLLSLHKDPQFQQILNTLRSAHIEVQDGAPFSHSTGWNHQGEPDPNGTHYMLSTFLGVIGGRGNSVDEIVKSLQRSTAADFSAPKGTIYFERNNDVRSTTRQWGFEPAAQVLRSLGIDAVVEEGVLPKDHPDIAGAMLGVADYDWSTAHSSVKPGAIIESLTSNSGMLNKGAPQTACTVLISNGASGTSGTVAEPFALQEKFPTPFIHVQYAKGFTLAESFYMSLSGPYQLLIIGDPLCRPWAKKVKVKASGVEDGDSISGKTSIHPSISAATPVAQYQLFVDSALASTAKAGGNLTLDPTEFDKGYHKITIVATLADAAASSYQTSIDVNFPSGTRKVVGTPEIQGSVSGTFQVNLIAKGAIKIELFHLGSPVATLDGDHGFVNVKGALVGQGSTLLYPVATYNVNGKTLRVNGPPLHVTLGI